MNDHIWNYVVNKKCDIFNFSIAKNSSVCICQRYLELFTRLFLLNNAIYLAHIFDSLACIYTEDCNRDRKHCIRRRVKTFDW